MNKLFAALASTILKGLLELVAPLLAYKAGKNKVEADIDKSDAEVLQRQRDNDVSSIADADNFWMRLRNKNK